MRKLSDAEKRVATLIPNGWANSDIAYTLGISDKTVKFHLTNIYKKLNVSNRTQLTTTLLGGSILAKGARNDITR